MAIMFHMLGSGSTGNCGLLRSSQSNILIDAGFSGKHIKELLSQHGLSIADIHAIFITHEHLDHIQGLRGLRKEHHLQFFANQATANAIENKFHFDISWNHFKNETTFSFRDFSVTSFSLPHDAADPVGYVFRSAQEETPNSLAWMTDLGYVPSHVAPLVRDVDYLVIESNYDNDLLTQDTKRPPYIKARIRSRYGHLPNEAAIHFLKHNVSDSWKKIVFAHVSADCNREDIIQKLVQEAGNFRFEFAVAKP